MSMKPKPLAVLFILCLIISLIPPVSAFEDTETRHIEAQDPGLDADWFATESGIGHGGPLVTVLDPNMDIYSYLWFEDIKVNYWQYVENATLWLRTASTMDFDADSSFTIYGVNDYRHFGSGTKGSNPFAVPSELINAPKTSAYVTYNSSEFHGPQWWNISVTNIVRELKSNPYWDGPGFVRSDPGDNMAFIILGGKGSDSRWFYAIEAGNGMEAKLEIHWGGSSHPPSGYEDAFFIETHGNYTIWRINATLGYSLDPMEFIYYNGSILKYNTVEGIGPHNVSGGSIGETSQRKLVRMSNSSLFAVYDEGPHIHIMQSDDNGTTWIGETELDTLASMSGHNQWQPSIAVDSQDMLHVVWTGTNNVYDPYTQIWYSKFNVSWSTPIRLSTEPSMDDNEIRGPVIAVDSNDNLHVAFYTDWGYTRISYTKYSGGSWSFPFTIYIDDLKQSYPSIAIGSNDYIHVVWFGLKEYTEFDDDSQIWYALYDGSWSSPVRISTATGMNNFDQTFCCIALDSNDYIHVVFEGDHVGGPLRIWYVNYTDSWSTPVLISGATYQKPSIAVDSNDYLHVMYYGGGHMYYENYTTFWSSPVNLDSTGSRANLRWARWPEPDEPEYFIADLNGTVIMDNGDPLLFDDIEDAEDWIDIYDPDPEDPNPGGEWDQGPGGETGAFTRFRMRLWFLIIGFGCLFGPVLFFAWRKPSGYYIMCGAIVMLIGIGLLMSIAQV